MNSERIKILHISPFLWSLGVGKGMPSVYLSLKGFVDAGHEVHLLFPEREEDVKKGTYQGINVHTFRFGSPPSSIRNKFLRDIAFKLYWLKFQVKCLREAGNLAGEIHPDVVYGHTPYGAPSAYRISRKFNIPNVTRLYGSFSHKYLGRPYLLLGLFEEMLAYKLPCSALIVTNDGSEGDKVASILRVPEDRLKFWLNGVDFSIYQPEFDADRFKESIGVAPDEFLVLALSRLVGEKRVDRLIDAIPSVVKRNDRVKFAIVGDGAERTTLEKRTAELDVSGSTIFSGAQPPEMVSKFLNSADLFVSLYDRTNLGNPLLEAMVCGKCVITIDNGGTTSVIKHDETGFLLKSEELETLPGTINSLLDNESERIRLGKAARSFAVQNFKSYEERQQMEVDLVENLIAFSVRHTENGVAHRPLSND